MSTDPKTFFTVTDERTKHTNSKSERMSRSKARAVARYRVASGKTGVFILKAIEHVSRKDGADAKTGDPFFKHVKLGDHSPFMSLQLEIGEGAEGSPCAQLTDEQFIALARLTRHFEIGNTLKNLLRSETERRGGVLWEDQLEEMVSKRTGECVIPENDHLKNYTEGLEKHAHEVAEKLHQSNVKRSEKRSAIFKTYSREKPYDEAELQVAGRMWRMGDEQWLKLYELAQQAGGRDDLNLAVQDLLTHQAKQRGFSNPMKMWQALKPEEEKLEENELTPAAVLKPWSRKQSPFDLARAINGADLVDRRGQVYKFICYKAEGTNKPEFKVVAQREGMTYARFFTVEGLYYPNRESQSDLMILEPRTGTKVG